MIVFWWRATVHCSLCATRRRFAIVIPAGTFDDVSVYPSSSCLHEAFDRLKNRGQTTFKKLNVVCPRFLLLVFLPAILFVVTGLRWLVSPAGVAPEFGLVPGDGLGLSTLVCDMASFFLTVGICMLVALVSGRRTWYYPPILLLLLTFIGRTIAWLLHDAALAVPQMGVELVVAIILLVASRHLAREA